jgi:diguanylate cyclase (GGDEF)-like protein/PAS domain S-box-containing protein
MGARSEPITPDAFQVVFEACPHPSVVVQADADFTIVAANDRYLAATLTRREDLLGRGLFEALPKGSLGAFGNDLRDLRSALTTVKHDRVRAVMEVRRCDPPAADGANELPVKCWRLVNSPMLDPRGRVLFIIVHAEDVTEYRLHETGEVKKVRTELEAALEDSQRSTLEIDDLCDNAPCGLHSLREDGTFVRINDTELRWLGFTRDEVVGKMKFSDRLTPPSRLKFEHEFARLHKQGAAHGLEYEMVRKDGSILALLVSAIAVRSENGREVVTRAAAFDFTERKRTEKTSRQMAAVFASTNEAIIVADERRDIIAVNPAFTRVTGFEPREVLGRNPRLQKSGRHDDTFYRDIWRAVRSTGQWQGEIWNRRKSGEIYPAWENISTVKDEEGGTINYISIFSDISAIKQAEEKLIRLAHEDALTNLPNRLLFNARLDQAMDRAPRRGHKIALLLLDLDRFKLINDMLGHPAGDRMLQVVAQRLKRTVRAEDTVARLGGDEFAILLDEVTQPQDAALVAMKIIEDLVEPMALDGRQVVISGSIGISIYPTDAESGEDLIKAADAAMYRAKERGRHTFEFYTAELTVRAGERLRIEAELRQALANAQLVLHYQPQVELSTGRITGVEALLRWQHPTRGMVLPDQFIAIAEESGLIEPIGDWVVNQALADAAVWAMQGLPPMRVGINLSGRQVLYDHVVKTIERALREHAVSPERMRIELEISESVMLSLERSANILQQLRALGVSIAIDDFGSGYSSLSHLKHLPIDSLKISRVFVQNMATDSADRAITSTIIAVGHNLRLKVIAEGVETREQLEFLRDQGCDEVQGHVICEAVRADEVTRLLRDGIAGAGRHWAASVSAFPAAQRKR